MQRLEEVLDILQAQDRPPGCQLDKRIRGREVGPGGWQGAFTPGGAVEEDHTRLAPSEPLCQEGKLLSRQRVKRMRDGEYYFSIHVIGYSRQFIQMVR